MVIPFLSNHENVRRADPREREATYLAALPMGSYRSSGRSSGSHGGSLPITATWHAARNRWKPVHPLLRRQPLRGAGGGNNPAPLQIVYRIESMADREFQHDALRRQRRQHLPLTTRYRGFEVVVLGRRRRCDSPVPLAHVLFRGQTFTAGC